MKIVKNSDENLVKEITKKLKENDGYCPCRLKKTEETKCMCKEFKDQIKRKEYGFCHCGLWKAVE